MTILFPKKNVCLIMMAISSIIVKYVFVKIIKSTYLRQLYLLFSIRRLYETFNPYSLMLDLREKEKKIVLLRFGFIGEERKKCLLYHLVEEKNIIS